MAGQQLLHHTALRQYLLHVVCASCMASCGTVSVFLPVTRLRLSATWCAADLVCVLLLAPVLQVAQALLGKPAAEAAGNDGYALRRLKADVQMQLTAFKNAAYTAGYVAGKDEVVAYATRRYA